MVIKYTYKLVINYHNNIMLRLVSNSLRTHQQPKPSTCPSQAARPTEKLEPWDEKALMVNNAWFLEWLILANGEKVVSYNQ